MSTAERDFRAYRAAFTGVRGVVERHEAADHGGRPCPDERCHVVAVLALTLGLTPAHLAAVALAMVNLVLPPPDAN